MEKKSKSLHPLHKCASATVLPYMSPVTDLSYDLDELSTSNPGTPKRRIAWSNISKTDENSDTDFPFLRVRSLKDDVNVPTQTCNAFSIKSRGLAIRRLKSMPATLFNPISDRYAPLQPLQESVVSPKKTNLFDIISDVDDTTSCDSGIYGDKEDGKSDYAESIFNSTKRFSPQSISKGFSKHSSVSSSTSSSGMPDFGSDDGFLDVFDMDMDEDTQLPSGMLQLLKGRLPSDEMVSTLTDSLPVVEQSPKNTLLTQILSEKNANIVDTPKRSCMRGLFRSPSDPSPNVTGVQAKFSQSANGRIVFKRPEPPSENSPVQSKRYRPCCHGNDNCQSCNQTGTLQKRSHSETEATIMRALQKSTKEPDLIGDFSKPFSLPLVKGKHQDLKCVSPNMVAQLIKGNFNETINNFKIVDCRYPYEYEGGHIDGAQNYYTHDQIEDELLAKCTSTSDSSTVLIFHCEFSSERAPKLLRYLRKKDREENQESYPSLFYPEMYLMDGGYKAFYESNKEMCEPQYYKPMHQKGHEDDLRTFRAKSRSWNADNKGRQVTRPGMKF